jgi:lipopolysaccharide biosynthesis glycosyltransferase
MGKLNFLYCFDENYNYQAFTSIISLLENVNQKINIFVIHSDEKFYKKIPKEIINHKYLDHFETFIFNDYGYNFPNTREAHVSEATYFRLFISNYLPNSIDSLIFLDADTVCMKNPIKELCQEIIKLKNSKYVLAAKTEHPQDPTGEFDIYNRLDMKGPYFNAGVLLIDFEKWNKKNFHQYLIKELINLDQKILQWDQDVLNSFIDGQYQQIAKKFNYPAFEFVKNESLDIVFIHYLGSKKPWLTSGMFEYESRFYHNNYRKIANTKYHITHKWKKTSLKDFVKSFFNLKIKNLFNPFSFTKEFIQSLFL